MKRTFNFLSALMAAVLLLAGCQADPRDGNPTDGGDRTITFTIPGGNSGGVTYVETKDGEADINHLDIYMFDKATQKLEWIFRHADIQLSGSGTTRSATIDVTERQGGKVFFFIGNGENICSQPNAARFGETTVAQFQEMITDTKLTLPVKPLLMTAQTEVADVTAPTDDEKKVQLKRRVARFDIHNKTTDPDPDKCTNFKITDILIGKVNQQAHLFDNPSRTQSAIMDAGNIDPIKFGDGTGHNEGETAAVFYTYPTTIGKVGTDTKTSITLQGIFLNETQPRVYGLELPDDFEIEANKRYILKAKAIRPNFVEFEVTVKEWENGEEVETKPNDHTVKMQDLKLGLGNGVLTDKTLDISAATQNSVLTFTAESYTKEGTRIDITYLHGSQKEMKITHNNPTPILTYSAHYEQKYEVTVEVQSPYKVPAEALVELVSVKDPRERVTLKVISIPIYDGKANMKPVKVGNIWWAPLNVKATALNAASNEAGMGTHHQWGRTYGIFNLTNGSDVVQGPLDATAANGSANLNKFIKSTDDDNWDWLKPKNDSLWMKDNRQGPCPAGWRIPTAKELQILADTINVGTTKATFTTNRVDVKGDDGVSILQIPLAGYRDKAGITYAERNTRGLYWSCDPYPNKNLQSQYLNITSTDKKAALAPANRVNGFSIRCVTDKY